MKDVQVDVDIDLLLPRKFQRKIKSKPTYHTTGPYPFYLESRNDAAGGVVHVNPLL